MTHLHCQQASCSALTASLRDSAQTACLSIHLSVRHTLILCRCHPDCTQFVRPSVRPSHYPSIARQPHRVSAQSACLSIHRSVHHTPTLCRYLPDCTQFVRPSAHPSHSGIVPLPPRLHPVRPSVCPSVTPRYCVTTTHNAASPHVCPPICLSITLRHCVATLPSHVSRIETAPSLSVRPSVC